TQEQAKEAVATLYGLIAEFPFVDGDHKASWLSALLTTFARMAIGGPCPLFLFDAPTAGSGQTPPARVIYIICTGRDATVSELSGDNEEMRKTITAILLEGDRLVLFDNASGTFGCPAIDAITTSPNFKGRILSKTKRTPDLPINTTFIA